MFLHKRERNTTIIPGPVSLTPANGFDGNDGRWSTFTINIGNDDSGRKGQEFKVLVSTSSPLVQIPIPADWCTTPDKETCAANRGVLTYGAKQYLGFQANQTERWKETGLYSLPPIPYFDGHPEQNLNASYGTVTVGLGPSSKESHTLAQQTVAGVNNKNFFMGSFGLAADEVDIGTESPIRSWLFNYHHFSRIPSMSYGYTAGAVYQNNGRSVPGSLTLGGYDHSRFTEAGISINMTNPTNTSLVVGVQSISYHPDENVNTNIYSLNEEYGGFYATIDSTFPYLWLPQEILDNFEERFHLQWDEENALYTVSESAHNLNRQQNAKVSFRIGQYESSSNDYATIVLPYAAFDLEARYPLIQNATDPIRYFPIKRSINGQYVLGRAFLQEAYLVVDYERNNFIVAPANFSDPMPASNIVTILPINFVAPVNGTKHSNSSGLSGGAIAGAAVGGVIGFLLILLAAFFIWKKKRSQHRHVETVEKPPDYHSTPMGVQEVKPYPDPHSTPSELGSNAPTSPSLNGFYVDRDNKDVVRYPAINEMESPPEPIAELESPDNPQFPNGSPRGAHSEVAGYFDDRLKRRGATRESSGQTTPRIRAGSPEVSKDDTALQADEESSEPVQKASRSRGHSRAPSEAAALTPSIDAVVSEPTLRASAPSSEVSDPTPRVSEAGNEPLDAVPESSERTPDASESPTETVRGPSSPAHARGPSDATVESAVSDPTPEQLEEWEREKGQPMRPLSE
jgi:hypothetical protein